MLGDTSPGSSGAAENLTGFGVFGYNSGGKIATFSTENLSKIQTDYHTHTHSQLHTITIFTIN